MGERLRWGREFRKSGFSSGSLARLVATHFAGPSAAADADRVPPVRSARIGIVGAGRSRNGLGPFLADAFTAAGATVVGVAGRDLAGAERAAAAISARLGRPVAAYPTAHALARAVDALAVASPVAAHADGLLAAHAAGIACLCEKPLVEIARTADGLALVEAFRQRGLLLEENCQWPFVLPSLFELHPTLRGQPVRSVAMGLGPMSLGRAMIEDSLSHVLSVVQALVAIDAAAGVRAVRQTDPGPMALANGLAFEVVGATGPVAVELRLKNCPQQPRPAWLAVNGCRIDRQIGAGYAQSFVADNKSVPTPDPLHSLVYRFVSLLQTTDLERTRAIADSLAVRIRCTASLFAALDR